MMLDEGYLDNNPELRLTFLKQQLRMLANTILDVRLQTMGMTDQEAMDLMLRYSYPGNIRELRNVIEHAMIVSSDKTLVVQAPRQPSSETTSARKAGSPQDVCVARLREFRRPAIL
jgi:transcriptional regulator with PAS, ATPase and Fis domain